MDGSENWGYTVDGGRRQRLSGRGNIMNVFNGLFPVLEGKEDAARAFANEAVGPRGEQFAETQRRNNVARETWSLLTTPMGSFVNVWFEGDVEEAFQELATADDEHTVWFRKTVLDITGVDLTAPDDTAPPEVILDWKA
jgi:hypothetical protein